MERVYKVKFTNYLNYSKTTIYDDKENVIDIGNDDFFIKESEIPKYCKYGGGIKSLEFVGNMCL